jgi:mono/diheme cytochrome c family protein
MKIFKHKVLTGLTLAASTILLLNSCATDPLSPGIEFMPDMYRSIAYKPYEENPNFKDMLGARPPVAGTISQGEFPNSVWGINNAIYPYPNTSEGYDAAGLNLKNPIELTPENLEKGKAIYTKFCTPCHGDAGDGNGSIVANGKFPSPGKYWDKVTTNGLNDGKMFHSITYGKNLMGQHASQITKEERWLVIHHINDLIKKATPNTAVIAATNDSIKK